MQKVCARTSSMMTQSARQCMRRTEAVRYSNSRVQHYWTSQDFLNSGCKFHEMVSSKECLQKGRQAIKQTDKSNKQHRGIFFVADSCQPCLELPDESRDPCDVSRISDSVSGREAKTETKKL